MKTASHLPPHVNLMLRLEVGSSEEESPEVYAKVLRPVDESTQRYLIHFTSVTPGLQAQLRRLIKQDKVFLNRGG